MRKPLAWICLITMVSSLPLAQIYSLCKFDMGKTIVVAAIAFPLAIMFTAGIVFLVQELTR